MGQDGKPLTAVDECPVGAAMGTAVWPHKQWSTERRLHWARKARSAGHYCQTQDWTGGQAGQGEEAGSKVCVGHKEVRRGARQKNNNIVGSHRPALLGGRNVSRMKMDEFIWKCLSHRFWVQGVIGMLSIVFVLQMFSHSYFGPYKHCLL